MNILKLHELKNFASKNGGQFASAWGGQFNRRTQYMCFSPITDSINLRTGNNFRYIFCSLGLLFGIQAMAQDVSPGLPDDDDTAKIIVPFYKQPNVADAYPVLYDDSLPNIKKVEAIGYLNGQVLNSTPASSPFTAITGRIAGLYIRQASGAPGADIPYLTLRGRAPLVLVDGVPRSTTAFNPEQIESVTVLKDALATAMLGQRAMNGAILITTKKGNNANGSFNLELKAQTGVQSPTRLRKFLGAYDYARLYNEALANDGRPALYSAADLQAYQTGSDPYGHPDIDWTKNVLKNNAMSSRYTLNAEGAAKSVRYFVSLDYLDQKGLFRESDTSSYSTNTNYKRYVFRSNLEVKIDQQLKAFINLFGRIQNGNEPGAGTGTVVSDLGGISFGAIPILGSVGSESILASLLTTPNNAYPVLNPNGSYGGSLQFQNNILGQVTNSGYLGTVLRDGFADVGFMRNMDDVLKGWWIKAMISYNTSLTHLTNRSKQYQVFKMNISAAGDTTYQRYGPDPLPLQANSSAVANRVQQFYSEVSTGYARKFNLNTLNVVLLASSDQNIVTSNLPNTYKGLSAKVSYDIDEKYIAQVAASYQGNSRFKPGEQYGFFPAAGLAWNVHKEGFFNSEGFLNTLKLRATYGLTGNGNSGYFVYLQQYEAATGYTFGANPGGVSGFAEAFLAPYSRTWEKGRQLNLGADGSFSKNRGAIAFDYYYNKLDNLLITPGVASSILGLSYPIQNLGKQDYSGWEFSLGWADTKGELAYDISANVAASQSKIVYNAEGTYPYPWMSVAGGQVGQPYGYIADGFVTAAGQGPVREGYQSVPGDIKYKDLNGDNVINQYDAAPIGSKKPLLFYGLGAQLKYGNFYLSFLVQGVANNQQMLTGQTVWEFSGGSGQAYPHHLDRWTPETANTASYPRLSIGTNFNNNVASTFWLRQLDYARLKNTELGYCFSGGFLKRMNLKGLRVFANGVNLVTISTFKLTDPETPYSNYPVQRVVNAGLAITF